ncbi:MAG: peptide chain release factor 1 [Actinomycetia bacterium]|nr:peptide chain release factor 1 [Actinomycetes bacterium]MCP4084686.1 peptide chain release factor 1 [Actinomycetes bacterium]
MLDRLDALEQEFSEVERSLADPAVINDQKKYADVARRYRELEQIVQRSTALRGALDDAAVAREMMSEASSEESEMLADEINSAEARTVELEAELRILLLPRDPNDDKNVIVEIRGAEGGEEANLFARDLFEMYRGVASSRGWGFELLESRPSDLGGFSLVSFLVRGDAVWSQMKHEAGVHRVQRVPETESQGRVHTSSATVMVLPEADEVDVVLDPNDLDIDVYRSSGPGGQSVNTTDSAVRITHKPSGLVVAMQDEKSQLQNKEKALRVLRSRLLQHEQDKQAAEASDQRRSQVGAGGRSEKIRTYNFKENRLTDHRVNLTIYKLDKVLDGELDDVSETLVQEERTRLLLADDA